MSHCGTPSFYDHLDHCFVVLKDTQQSFRLRKQKSTLFRSSIFPEIFFRVRDVGLSVLDHSDACFREVKRGYTVHPFTCIQGNDFGFC